MAVEKTVRLSRGYEAHGRTFDRLVFREPKMADFEDIGEIAERQPSPMGGEMIIYHDDRVWKYRDRLLKRGDDLPSAADLGDLDLVDGIAIKDAITGFFSRARGKSGAEPPTS
jgi:hypothetical protein